MLVIIIESVTRNLRGELTRWLLEVQPGVFVGHVSARVRERLWLRCLEQMGQGGVLQIWSTNTEQRFRLRMAGTLQRKVVELEGVQLIAIPPERRPQRERDDAIKDSP